MTRIIAGSLRGRTLAVPKSGTRPTSDRVREALFSAISSRIDLDGAQVLDLYAGSGALGIEALSRGASAAWFVEKAAPAVSVLRSNTQGLAGVTVRRGSVTDILRGPCPVAGGFDLVLADPPYELSPKVDEPVLAALLQGGWTAPGALVVWERSSRTPGVRWTKGFEAEPARAYGETSVELARVTGAQVGLLLGTVSP